MNETRKDLVREASDPCTSTARLGELARQSVVDPDLCRALSLNPSLPFPILRARLLGKHGDAWFNPSVPLLLLEQPGQELAAAAIERMIVPTRYPYRNESSAETLTTLAYHVQRREREEGWSEAQRRYAARFAELFGFPWSRAS